jgi:hypothetical protein
MTNMVERVARRLCTIDGHNPDLAIGMEDGEITLGWSLYRDDARLVIEEMREPSIKMRHAGNFEFFETGWPRIIDAALCEDKT